MISIVIPTFNNSSTIELAINSVLNQTASDYEIIIIDDGSTDNTSDVINKYVDNGTVRYFKKSNGGCSSARNYGINKAEGEIIAFLDADDEWLKDHLKKKYALMQTGNFDWVAGGFYKRFTDKALEYRTITNCDNVEWNESSHEFKLLVNGIFWFSSFPIQLNTVLFRKCAILGIDGFDEKFTTSEDWDLYLKAEIAGLRSGFLDEPSAIYNFNPSGITKSDSYDCINDQLLLAKKYSELLGLNNRYIIRSYADFIWHAGRTYLITKRYMKSIKCFVLAMQIDFNVHRLTKPISQRVRKCIQAYWGGMV
ncbi:MAG: glycosyltransferase family 2 protein [Deltaproteobacteria bacterium]|nr:glycosyltransferase family 2 protein [Deltaproteobacteria bacterium]